jgi:hypothetical protein
MQPARIVITDKRKSYGLFQQDEREDEKPPSCQVIGNYLVVDRILFRHRSGSCYRQQKNSRSWIFLGYLYVRIPAGVGPFIMLIVALLVNNIPRNRRYPEFWL